MGEVFSFCGLRATFNLGGLFSPKDYGIQPSADYGNGPRWIENGKFAQLCGILRTGEGAKEHRWGSLQ